MKNHLGKIPEKRYGGYGCHPQFVCSVRVKWIITIDFCSRYFVQRQSVVFSFKKKNGLSGMLKEVTISCI